MNRNVAAGVVVGVAAITAALLFLLTPSTGPGVTRSTAPPVAAAPVAMPHVEAAPSPRPTNRPHRGPRGAEGLGLPGPPRGRGDIDPDALSPRRMVAAGPLRGRYTERGYERIVRRIDAIAADRDWDEATHAEVLSIVETSQKAGAEVLQRQLDGEFEKRGGVAVALNSVRQQELDDLRAVLGDDAEVFVQKAGLSGRSMRRPMAAPGRQQPIDE